MSESEYRRLCHGVYWLLRKNRDQYAFVMAEVARHGGNVRLWSLEVQEAAENGFAVTEEWEPT